MGCSRLVKLPETTTLPALETTSFLGIVGIMEDQKYQQHSSRTLRDLYPTLTETQLKEAEANLRRYFEIAAEVIHEQAVGGADVDNGPNPTTMEERSNTDLKT